MKKLALVAALALTSNAHALTITDSFSNAEQTTEISQSGLLDYFDSNLGILDSVQLFLEGAMTTTITLTNNAVQTQVTKGTGTVDLFFTGVPALSVPVPAVSLSATTGFVSLNAGETQSYGPLTNTGFWDSGVQTGAGILSAFSLAGGGTFSVGCSSLSGITITGGGGNIGSDQATTAGCSARVEYVYHDAPPPPPPSVPEPATLGLLGLGLLGLGFARRRKAA